MEYMNRFIIYLLLLLSAASAHAQGLVKGKVLDRTGNTPLEFVNVKLTSEEDTTKMIGGSITDVSGHFAFQDLSDGHYRLTLTFVGYKTVTRNFAISSKNRSVTYAAIYMGEDAHLLKEVQVTGQKSAMKLEVDRKSFDVSQLVSNAGQSASDVLENIPSVDVDNDGNISLRGNTSVEVWINGKASGLTSDNRAQILQQLPAESIDHIEVIDNPSAKFSAEGSAGIINIVLKKNRQAGYYGSLQAGGDTRGGASTSFNINYTSSKWDAYANVGYRHRKDMGRSDSEQEYPLTHQYQNYHSTSDQMGNGVFSRAGLTWHATTKDDFSLSGMMMNGKFNSRSATPYHYGTIGAAQDTRLMLRQTDNSGLMHMYHGEFDYRHSFTEKHFLDFTLSYDKWKMNNDNIYRDSTEYFGDNAAATKYDYQYRPMFVNNHSWDVKLDYENPITDKFKIQAGYEGTFSHENTPQESWIDASSWTGKNLVEDKAYYNRFIYDMDLHALYFTAQYQLGKLGIMGGLRGEYWKVNTESYTWEQEHDASLRDKPFNKDYFQLFPSVFMSYQVTKNDQFQLNYTRRLRRPWGGQLNSFRNTSDATMVSFGNPELTPEYSNSFSLNYLRTWTEHSLLVSAYYRPTTDVMQRINWQNSSDGLMYQTNMNVARSTSSGVEATLKDNFFRILDLTTNLNAYYYKLNGFSYDIDGQTVTGEGNHNFTWNARMIASVILPYDISVQFSGRYRARQVITQGYRKAGSHFDLGVRKNFFNKKLTLSINCRDLFNSRKWDNFTSSDTFWRHQLNKRGSRKVSFTVTWNFGNTNKKKRPERPNDQEDNEPNDQYGGGEAGNQ
jgi:iron complex outermembrane receptor protein